MTISTQINLLINQFDTFMEFVFIFEHRISNSSNEEEVMPPKKFACHDELTKLNFVMQYFVFQSTLCDDTEVFDVYRTILYIQLYGKLKLNCP